jgi:flagellar hook protein FlgE
MASTTALLTGLTGLNANARNLDVIGNNIANVNTTAFKSSRLNFSTMFSRTMSLGSPPSESTGGTNPYQIGLGVRTSGTQRNFNNGAITSTGDLRDLAIDGDGFFVVNRAGKEFYTRAGNFRPDEQQYLATPGGERLRGYGIDENYNIVTGAMTDVRIPLGQLTIAEATQNVHFRGNLNANGTLPSRGSGFSLTGTQTAGFRTIAAANPPPTGTNLLEATSRLVDIEDPLLVSSGTPLFSSGQSLELKSAEKGGKTVPGATLPITATTTVDDLLTFLETALGISTAAGNNPDGSTPGLALDPSTGVLSVVGNAGSVNDLDLDSGDLRILDSAGQVMRQPFVSAKTGAADGESVRTTFVAFDSLGTPVQIDLAMILEGKSNSGTTWRYMVESADSAGLATQLTTGTLAFDTEGQLVNRVPVAVQVDRSGSGAFTPLDIDLHFSQGDDNVSALTDERSAIAATFRDGSPIGTLSGFGIGLDGSVTGTFTNGLTRTLGQIPVATFTNNEGLTDEGNNLFSVGVNSGNAQVVVPGTLGAGRVVGGALEGSNVDLSEEFIKMITTSTGFSASSRVIRTADELMQQLLVIGR